MGRLKTLLAALICAVTGVHSPAMGQTIQGGTTSAGAPQESGNIGTRIFGGRMANVVVISGATTYEALYAVAAPDFEAVRCVLAAGYDATATSPVFFPAVAAVADAANVNGSTFVLPAGAYNLTAAAAANRRKLTYTTWARIASVARTDGGTLPLVACRAYVATGTVVMLGNGVQTFTNWATHPSGRIARFRQQAVDGINTPANFNTTTNVNTTPIVGVQYISKGKVYSIGGLGDSITEGQGTYIGEGFGLPAAVTLSQTLGVPVEWSNLGWSGMASSQITQQCTDAMTDGLTAFDLMFLPTGSPNTLSTPITATDINNTRSLRGDCEFQLQSRGVKTLPWTMLATNPAVKDYNSSDSLRVALNDSWRTSVARGTILADFDNVLKGVTDGDGQVNMLVGSTSDGIHPNDTGNALLAPVAARAALLRLKPPYGQLIQ